MEKLDGLDYTQVSQLFRSVEAMIERGDPVPVDLTAQLLEAGYDVSAMYS